MFKINVTKELNTLLTALYVVIDAHVVPPRAGRGRRPLLSDSELITVAVAQVLRGITANVAGFGISATAPSGAACFRTCPTSPGTTSGSKASNHCCAAGSTACG